MPEKKLSERRNIQMEPIQGASSNTSEDVQTTSKGNHHGFDRPVELNNDPAALKIESTRTRNTKNNNQSKNISEPIPDNTDESTLNSKMLSFNGLRKSPITDTRVKGKETSYLSSADEDATKIESSANRNNTNNNNRSNIKRKPTVDRTAGSPQHSGVSPLNGVNTKDEYKGENPTLAERIFSWRGFMAILLHLAFYLYIAPTVSMSLALVCMVDRLPSKPTDSEMATNSTWNQISSVPRNISKINGSLDVDNATKSMREIKEFHWDSQIEGFLLSGPSFSGFLGPLMAAFLKDYLGSKLTLTLFVTLGNLVNFLAPVCARVNPYVLVANRVVSGMAMGANVPIVGEYVAYWFAESEKLTTMSFAYAGFSTGSMVSSFVSGFLCNIPLDNGWPFIFYFLGIFGVLWQLAWHFLSSSSPETHRFISEREKNYIKAHRQRVGQGDKTKPPYRKILTSIPVYAYTTVGIFHVWNMSVLSSYVPIYMSDVLKFSVQETGVLYAALVVARLFATMAWASIGNYLLSRRTLSKNASRKIITSAGFLGASVISLVVSFFNQDHRWLVLGLLVVIMLFQSVGTSTLPVIPLDMAPKYAGFLSGTSMSLAMLIGISGPMIVSILTPTGSYEEWRRVWILVAAVFTTGCVFFVIFGHVDIQPWAEPDTNKQLQTVNSSVKMGGKSELAIQNLGFEKEEEGPSRSEQSKESELRNTDVSESYEVDIGEATCSSHIDNNEVLTTGYTADKANWSESTRL